MLKKKVTKKAEGGKAPPLPGQRIIELFGEEPGFSGIEGGIDSGENKYYDYYDLLSNVHVPLAQLN